MTVEIQVLDLLRLRLEPHAAEPIEVEVHFAGSCQSAPGCHLFTLVGPNRTGINTVSLTDGDVIQISGMRQVTMTAQ